MTSKHRTPLTRPASPTTLSPQAGRGRRGPAAIDEVAQSSDGESPTPQGDLWVFGYGSLMWRPGFDYLERQPALLHGYHRALCILSYDHRGTRERPGLVLGLDRGGACRGVAFRVAADKAAATHAYLTAREQTSMVYEERMRPLRLGDGRRVAALAYTANHRHEQYAGVLTREQQLAHILQGVGRSGANPDYVLNTHAHLVEIGVHDALLDWLAAQLTSHALR